MTNTAAPEITDKTPLIIAENIDISFATYSNTSPVVRDVSLQLFPGEVLGIVGESGSGKSTLVMSLLRLLPANARVTAKKLRIAEQDLLKVNEHTMAEIRGNQIGMIFQNPISALNPMMSIGAQVMEPLLRHNHLQKKQARAIMRDLITRVGLNPAVHRRYPHELSGGMCQRAMIAIALAAEPRVLIADEPTTALDVTVQAQIIELLDGLIRKSGMSMIIVSHDLGVISWIADRVAVMYAGKIVETGNTHEVLTKPAHPYTRALLECIPSIGAELPQDRHLVTIEGEPASAGSTHQGCAFAPRCKVVMPRCATDNPQLLPLATKNPAAQQLAACWLSAQSGQNIE